MKKIIENLQNAHDDVKRPIVIGISVVLTLIILIISYLISNPFAVSSTEKEKATENGKELLTPFQALRKNFTEMFGTARKDISDLPIKDIFNNLAKEKERLENATTTETTPVEISTTTTNLE